MPCATDALQAHRPLLVEQLINLEDLTMSTSTSGDLNWPAIVRRLARLRAGRRKIGWFDFASDSWDMRTTTERAARIWARICGRRQPLLNPESQRPVPWNSFHH